MLRYATALLLLGLSATLSAESINTPPAMETSGYSVELPGRGMSKAMVEKRFGKALEKTKAVGTPPISTWTYNIFTVYFESEFVIHAVVNK